MRWIGAAMLNLKSVAAIDMCNLALRLHRTLAKSSKVAGANNNSQATNAGMRATKMFKFVDMNVLWLCK